MFNFFKKKNKASFITNNTPIDGISKDYIYMESGSSLHLNDIDSVLKNRIRSVSSGSNFFVINTDCGRQICITSSSFLEVTIHSPIDNI
jgi:hypothetical protein